MRASWSAVVVLAMALPMWASEPKPEAVKAFDRYVAVAEARIRMENSHPSNTGLGGAPDASFSHPPKSSHGGVPVLVEKVGRTPQEVPGGMIHDWIGTAFIPGATVGQVLALVQDYDQLARYYQPDVQASRLISRNGDDFHIYMRLRKHKVVTVLLDTEYDVHYGHSDPQHWYSESRSTRIAEADGGDHGFLWRLNSYWQFVQVEGGVVVQCEAISLTRDIPTGLGWMIGPFVTSIPRQSLEFTMSQTRAAVERIEKCSVVSAQCSAKANQPLINADER